MIVLKSESDQAVVFFTCENEEINPYGDMKLMDLKRWFNSKGFILLENNIFILFP